MNSRALEIVHRKVCDLIPYARNSRTHSDEQVRQIAASIKEFGFTNPVLIDTDDGIIAGHGRVLAASKLKFDTVPCIVLADLTPAQKRAYVIADNKLALNAGWNFEMLAVEIDELNDEDFDLSILGFTQAELNELIGTPGVAPEAGSGDEVPDVEARHVSQYGDVWLLGEHRVMCGDSTSAADISKLMNGTSAQLLHADPPYGMGKQSEGVENDNLYADKLDRFQQRWWSVVKDALTTDSSAYVWGWEHNLCLFYVSVLVPLINANKATHKNWIVWSKGCGQGMRQESLRRYAPVTEHCLFFAYGVQEFNTNADNYWSGWDNVRTMLADAVNSQGWKVKDLNRITGTKMGNHWITTSQWTFITEDHYNKLVAAAEIPSAFSSYEDLCAEYEKAKQSDIRRSYFDNTHDSMTDVWKFPRVTGDERHGHATPKPVAMMERVMRSSLPEGGICLEPFGGSGSTLIGAEKTGRICYTMELQEQFVDVIVKRWQSFTGKEAVLEHDGRTFDEIANERLREAA